MELFPPARLTVSQPWRECIEKVFRIIHTVLELVLQITVKGYAGESDAVMSKRAQQKDPLNERMS